ncbi:MAG: ankyrin repeat domain-containing protein [Candidatus Sericytochromatia bacterium]|nr:ankyrin repeat domain-containing protein [Candidatus Sericytochromatia bacterium]
MFRLVAPGLLLALAITTPAAAQVLWLPAPRPLPTVPPLADPWGVEALPAGVEPWRPEPLARPAPTLEVRLYQAVARGDLAGVKQLVEQGARVESRDRAGMSPLAWAAQRGRTAVAAYLVTRRVNLNPLDHHGFTPLMWAAQEGHVGVVEVLLRAGANPWVRNRHGVSALWLARWSRHAPTIAMLEGWLTGRVAASPRPRPVVAATAAVAAAPSATPTPAPPVAAPAAAPTPGPAAPAAAREQALLRLAQAGNDFRREYQAHVTANPASGLAFLGVAGSVDDQVGGVLTRFYANVARTQDLAAARVELEQAKALLGADRQSRFARFVVEADQALLAAGG